MKCNNCGAEVADGMKFCGDCGAPVPQEKKCISCGATIALKMKFCPECGAEQTGTATGGKPKFNAAAFAMGDKNVIAGDVVGHQETTHITGNATIIKNEDQSKQVKRCHVCGSLVLITDGFECPECGEFTCSKCYDANENACKPCAQKRKGQSSSMAENQYCEALKNALTDGRIDLEERKNLNALQKKLGISNDKAMEMERALKGAGTGDEEIFTTAEKLELDKAREAFYACDENLSDILKTSEGIWRTHPTNEQALSLYLPALASSGKTDEALKIISELGADILSVYITAVDIMLTLDDMTEAEKWLKKAAMVFAESNVLKCYHVYYYLKMYKKYNDFSFLEKATNANASLKNVNGPLELSHQLRVMSLLQIESGEEPPAYDKDFCKENNLYFRVVSNSKLCGVYVEGIASVPTASSSSVADVVPKDYFVEDLRGEKRQVWFFVRKDEKPDADGQYYDFGALVSFHENEEVMLLIRHEDYIDPEQYYTEDESDLSRDEQEQKGLEDLFKYCFEGKQIDVSQIYYKPQDPEEGESDEQAFERHLQIGINDEYVDGYELMLFNIHDCCENFDNYTDMYGNICSVDTSFIAVSNSDFGFFNVKELINEGGSGDDCVYDDYLRKIPVIFYTYYKYNEYEQEQYPDIKIDEYIRDEIDHYILDANGNKVKSLKDLESFEHNGITYYRVDKSDFVGGDTENALTLQATIKWRKKLGL
ncbi:MAG: zinc ribbon domain-containing protein [Treponema sp.]|nr:zinc ribbon domain-containing protein [Treponema sp.]